MLSLYEILKASKTGIAPDMWTALAGMNWGGADSGAEVKELTGIPPLTFKADGSPLIDWAIYGNTIQNGTPTPQNPVDVVGCGERTKNLFDKDNADIADLYPDATTREIKQSSNLSTWSIVLPVEPSTTYTFTMGEATTAIRRRVGMCSDYPTKGAYCTSVDDTPEYDQPNLGNIFTTDADTRYVLIMYVSGAGRNVAIERANRVQVVKGNTALPYEPYGYKIPISSGGENLFPQDSLTGRTTVVRDAFNEIASSIAFNNGQYVISMNIATEPTTSIFKLCFTYTDDSQDKSSWITKNTPTMTLVSNSAKVVKSISITDYNNFTDITLSNIMLNRGSTTLPYEPYIEPTKTNIYLGEVQTTRKIKKLVLDGTENWQLNNRIASVGGKYFNLSISTQEQTEFGKMLCSHYPVANPYDRLTACCVIANYSRGIDIRVNNPSTVENITDFKSYLAAQYANGTPVTVWYVLATPETAVVNEPLRKIGDYADTLSYEQAGAQIPTLHGNTVIDVETELKPSEMYIKYQE